MKTHDELQSRLRAVANMRLDCECEHDLYADDCAQEHEDAPYDMTVDDAFETAHDAVMTVRQARDAGLFDNDNLVNHLRSISAQQGIAGVIALLSEANVLGAVGRHLNNTQ